MKKLLLICALSLGLSGCLTINPKPPPPPPAVVISSQPPVVPPVATPLTPAPVQWKVYNAAELKAMATTGTLPSVLISLDEANFKNLANNLVDIKKYIDQQNVIITFLTKAANAPSATTTPVPTTATKK